MRKSGDGYYSLTEVNGKKYKNYRQNLVSYGLSQHYMGSNFAYTACGPTALAIVASGLGIDKTPGDFGKIITEKYGDMTGPDTLKSALEDVGIKCERGQGSDSVSTKYDKIKAHLQTGNPVLLGISPVDTKYSTGGHWLCLLALNGEEVTVSNPWRTEGADIVYGEFGSGDRGTTTTDLKQLINKYCQDGGYLLVEGTDQSKTTSSNNSTKKSSKNNKTSKTSKSSNSGEAKIEKCNVSNGGYEAIFTSGTTGRQFKEFKQNSPNYSYPNVVNTYWGQECSTVALGIIGSGYKNITIQDIADKLNGNNGGTDFTGFLSSWTGQNIVCSSVSSLQEFKNLLSKGYVAVIHNWGYSARGHYLSILDISKDGSQVYISNPDVWDSPSNGATYEGWNPTDRVYNAIDKSEIYFATNDGSTVDYSGTGTEVNNIAEDKIFYIGDSWIELMRGYGDAKSPNSYFYCRSGTNADWVLDNYNVASSNPFNGKSLKDSVPSDISCFVIKYGLNGTTMWKKTQELVDKLLNDYPDKEVFVLQTPHVGKEYSYGNSLNAETMNSNIDTYNKHMSDYCNGKDGATFINPTINIVSDDGNGYLKETYASGTFHLNNAGDQVWYKDIIDCIKNSGIQESQSLDMSANIIPRDEKDLSKGYKINIDLDSEIDTILGYLEELGVKMENYLSSKRQHEYLKNMIKACIVTQYPDLRSAKEISEDKEIPANEVQGCVKIKRYVDDQTKSYTSGKLTNPTDKNDKEKGIYLEYKKYDDLVKMINDGDKAAFNYFSMDTSNNIVVAGWETMDVSVNINNQDNCPVNVYGEVNYDQKAQEYDKLTIKSINYLDQISNYTLQFSLFWSLLVYGHDQTFINDFADLVINTDIVLGCYDAVTTTTTTYTQEFDIAGVADNTNYMDPDDYDPTRQNGVISQGQNTVTYHFVITEVDTLKTDNPELKVKYADIWTAIYNKDYEIEVKEDDEESDKPTTYEEEILDRMYYRKIMNADGELEYSKDSQGHSNSIQDEKLRNKVDESIEKDFKDSRTKLEKETEKKNESIKYRYDKLSKFIEDHGLANGSASNLHVATDDLNKFLKIKEVQDNIINCIIDMASDEYIEKIFSTSYNQSAEDATQTYKLMLIYAEEINSNNSVGILDGAETITKSLVNHYVIENGGTDSELYKSLTKNGTDTKKAYTVASMYSSQISVVNKVVNKTEEYEKQTEKEQVKEVPTDKNIKWKIDPKAKENSFVKLLVNSKEAKPNLRIVRLWFFDSLEETAAIADMEDLMKFLFQCVYGEEYGISEEDADKLLEMFDPKNMASFNKQKTKYGTIVGGASYSSIKLTGEELQMLYKLVQAENSTNPTWTACTVLNRILSSAFPNTMSEVVFASNQFEVTWTGAYDAAVPTQETIDAINEVLKTGDVSGGSIGFQTIELYDSQYPNQTWETPIETLREDYGWGGSSVYFTTASIQAELAQYK